MKLLIVESPHKIKKLKSFLPDDWDFAATLGHIRDLPANGLGIDKSDNFKMLYEVNPDKKKLITDLKNKVKKVGTENVFLATDPDREGEAISFHLCSILNLDYKTAKRVTFNNITKETVIKAVSNPRKLDLDLIKAQEGRRALDRLVGYQISPLLWKKLPNNGMKALSAGRVQSVALRLVVDRERTILEFKESFNFNVQATFQTKNHAILKGKLNLKFNSADDCELFIRNSISKKYFVEKIESKPVEKKPLPPFSTSTLQQVASRSLKLPIDKIMKIAQALYEGGHITYMRTDSINLSDEAIDEAHDFIKNNIGPEYAEKWLYTNKIANSQEAHEAIRPTHFNYREIDGSEEEKKLYDLIYRRAIASQMKSAIEEKTMVLISSSSSDSFIAHASLLKFDGYLKIYNDTNEQDEEKEEATLPPNLNLKDELFLQKISGKQSFNSPPKRFDQAALVKELERLGIGRPATYAPIISNIISRGYITSGNKSGKKVNVIEFISEKGMVSKASAFDTIGADKNKLFPTDTGNNIIQYMEKFFREFIDYKFTAEVEDSLDKISEGKFQFHSFVKEFDGKLSSLINKADKDVQDIEGNSRQSKLRGLGDYLGEQIKVGKGEHGIYILYKQKFYNVTEIPSLENLTLEKAIEIIAKKDQSDSISLIRKIGSFQVRKGQYGEYITDGKTNARLPDGIKVEELSIEKCKEIIKEKKKKRK